MKPEIHIHYTDIGCGSNETAQRVCEYLMGQVAEQEEPPDITAYVEKATVRITHRDVTDRNAWDMQCLGFRDGLEYHLAHDTRFLGSRTKK